MYPFVAAAAQYGRRKGPVQAFIVHMAEGGGTVGFLSRPNTRGVSVHYVIEYTGRIVQMVSETDATGSINPNDIRRTDDPDGFYGVTAAKAVMGGWWGDPNSAAITCEVEGFAKAGPNAAQHGSLRTLVNDVRSRFPSLGLLGHRDFADYKACPGKLIHWDELGGHGPQEDNMDTETTYETLPFGGTFSIPANTVVRSFRIDAGKVIDGPTFGPSPTSSSAHYDATVTTTATRGGPFLRCIDGVFKGYLIPASQVTETPNPTPSSDTTHTVTLQVDGTEKARISV